MKRKKSSLTHIKKVLDGIFSPSVVPVNMDDARIWLEWDTLVGGEIAGNARPFSIKRGRLVVKVTDSIWLQELEFRAPEIKGKINRGLQREAVKNIRFTVKEFAENKGAREDAPGEKNSVRKEPYDKKQVEEFSSRIKDKRTREHFYGFMSGLRGGHGDQAE